MINPIRQEPSVAGDVISSAAGGLASGIASTIAAPEAFARLGKSGLDYLAERLLPEDLAKRYASSVGSEASARAAELRRMVAERAGLPSLPSPLDVASSIAAAVPKPQTTAGEYARTIGEFAPAALAPGGVIARTANVAVPAVASETAGQLTEGTALEPYARIGGAIAGGLVPAMATRAISPNPISPERQQMIDVLTREGVPTTAGQRTGNDRLRYAESEIGGAKAANILDDQAEAFTSAALGRVGGSGRALPDNMRAIETRLSNGFKSVSARNTVRADQALSADLQNTVTEYHRVLPSEQRKIVDNFVKDLAGNFQAGGGSVPGADYQMWRSRFTKRASNAAASADVELATAYRGLRDALDNAMERSVSPQDAAEWSMLRRQWGNFETLKAAAAGAGEDAAMGLISPARLRNSVASNNKGAYVKGQGDLSELARAGTALMRQMPQSGTAPRTAVRNMGAAIPTVAGAVLGGQVGDGALGSLLGATAGAVAPSVVGRLMMSEPAQAYLSNQLASRSTSAGSDALLALLLASANNPMLRPIPPQ
ncbi:MAG: hypothetical protein ABFE07_06135 [Armatimonadia bacterium]